ncbi:unnamed protein product [Eruca vesicaria subsp. sativa]|uniref:GIR1-like zinc ribbon domain-containing protein n=1 Tax=Eruca vesicaria subsp. sativa TaxID=29727 RepID=A0ABC8KK86_ERUVS|nr:unnamed protein product [Eruca vesicaria subsp. sativa]
MAADVSSIARLLSGHKDDRTVAKESSGTKTTAAPMTRDLLGSGRGGGDRSLELDLDLQVPTGWEKRLDLKSGKVYLQRCSSFLTNQTVPTFQDLNIPLSPCNSQTKPLLNLFDDTTPSLSDHPIYLSPNRSFQSVCKLDKVKSALERVERDPVMLKKRQSPDDDHNNHKVTTEINGSPVAAGCPGCLSYVLVTKNNPRCPRCDTIVSLPSNSKKSRIDLNISI